MKTLELTTVTRSVEELFDLAATENVIVHVPNGKRFLVSIMDEEGTERDDFADEIARTRHNTALMQLLRERSHHPVRYSAQHVRERLGIPTSSHVHADEQSRKNDS